VSPTAKHSVSRKEFSNRNSGRRPRNAVVIAQGYIYCASDKRPKIRGPRAFHNDGRAKARHQ
jgi:hypothetical protein